MRPWLVLALAALCVPVAGAASVRSVTAPAPVLALAQDGRLIAYAAGRSAHDCNRVYVWNLSSRGVSKLGRSTHCVETSTGNAIGSLAIAGKRVLWLHFAGGNRRNYTIWTATTTRPLPRLLASREVDVDDPAPLVVGDGDDSPLGSILPYASGRDVIALRADGARGFSWRAPARVVALSALDGELAVATDGGTVTVLDAAGRVESTLRFVAGVRAVKLTGNGVLAQVGNVLELRRGAETLRFALPRGARLTDALADRALYVVGQQARQLRFAGGAQQLVAVGSHVEAELGTAAVASGRTVSARPLP
jgi:hypothetical protein